MRHFKHKIANTNKRVKAHTKIHPVVLMGIIKLTKFVISQVADAYIAKLSKDSKGL